MENNPCSQAPSAPQPYDYAKEQRNLVRNSFAASALIGILANWEGNEFPLEIDTATKAFQYADAMLEESEKKCEI